MVAKKQKVKVGKGEHIPFFGSGKLTVTLDQIVDYAKEIDDKEDAEKIELMCYRMFGKNLTPESAQKIAEIPDHFKKRCAPTIGQFIKIDTLNDNGDKVNSKTVIPNVCNYNAKVNDQYNTFPMPEMEKLKHKSIKE